MPNYKCINKKCEKYNKIVFVSHTNIKIVRNKVIDKAAICDVCGKKRISVKDDGYTTMVHGSKNIPIK